MTDKSFLLNTGEQRDKQTMATILTIVCTFMVKVIPLGHPAPISTPTVQGESQQHI